MLSVRAPATPGDIASIRSRGLVVANLDGIDLSCSASVVDECGDVLGCAGLVGLFDRTAEAWSVFSQRLFDSHALAVTRIARATLPELQRSGGFHRVTAMTPADRTHSRWLEILGFECEGILKQFGPGAQGDWCVMGKIGGE